MHRREWAAIGAATIAIVAAVAVGATVAGAGGGGLRAETALRDPSGKVVGWVTIKPSADKTHSLVRTTFDGTGAAAALDAFHGFHIHANNLPANGEGCGPDAVTGVVFGAVDGHWNPASALHGDHLGDMPSLFVNASGRTEAWHVGPALPWDQLAGRAIIVHAGPDNFANVPVGTNADQYTANSAAAITATQGTGNAGARIACGVLKLSR